MGFMLYATALVTVVLSGSGVTTSGVQSTLYRTRPPLTMNAVSALQDSVCTTTKLSGTVTDTAHKGRGNVWVQDGIIKPIGQKAKADSQGAFDLMLDQTHSVIWVFADSTSTEENQSIGRYVKSRLQIKNCVATPITIVIKQ